MRARMLNCLPGHSYFGTGAELLARVQDGQEGRIYGQAIEDLERELFGCAIKMAHGNQAKAARWLGISRLTLREKLTQLGLHPSQSSQSV